MAISVVFQTNRPLVKQHLHYHFNDGRLWVSNLLRISFYLHPHWFLLLPRATWIKHAAWPPLVTMVAMVCGLPGRLHLVMQQVKMPLIFYPNRILSISIFFLAFLGEDQGKPHISTAHHDLRALTWMVDR